MTKPKAAKKAGKKSARKSAPAPGSLVPARNGGKLRQGSLPGNTPGTGRPPDEIRKAMRELGATKGLPFLSGVLDGEVKVRFVGMCPHCKKESPLPEGEDLDALLDTVGDAVRTSVDHRLKANEQALKYGLGTKEEITVVSPDVKVRLSRQVGVITSLLEPADADALLAALDAVWT